MSMVDMKLTPKEAKEEKAEYDGKMKPPAFPWGLQIRLEKEELAKLKLGSLPNVGDEFQIAAIGRVTGVSSSMRDQSDDEACVTIQIIALDLSGEVKAAPKKAAPGAKISTVLSKH